MRSYQITTVLVCTIGMSACSTMNFNDSHHNSAYPDYTNNYNNSSLYPESYESTSYPLEDSYIDNKQNFNSVHSSAQITQPLPAKDVDHQWINNQQPNSYTIVLSQSESPAAVAGTLSKAPKKERMAEIKYQHGDKTYYEGLYGSYSSKPEAEQVLSTLPIDIRLSANITQWSSVQQQVQ